ncbi:hypothetical protein OV090_43170 [Nannocystis sp. RBIL2]|nr:hypothetical protein [Nannocystis sp. RBIL2]MCY1071624.1 hypothetical protein [Nannocystis sp. RBIL2]
MERRVGFGRLWAVLATFVALALAVVFTAAPSQRLFERFSEDSVSIPAVHDTPFVSRQQTFDAQRSTGAAPSPSKKCPAALPSLLSPLYASTHLTTMSGHQSAEWPSSRRGRPTARGPPMV